MTPLRRCLVALSLTGATATGCAVAEEPPAVRAWDSGAPLLVDEVRPRDTNDSVPDLRPAPLPRPAALDAPKPPRVVCGAPIEARSALCPADYPQHYACPTAASPTSCVPSPALGAVGTKLVCCR